MNRVVLAGVAWWCAACQQPVVPPIPPVAPAGPAPSEHPPVAEETLALVLTPPPAQVPQIAHEEPGDVITARITPRPRPATAANAAEWHWDSPAPQGNDLDAIWGSDANDLYAAGHAGTLLHSTDGGATWLLTYLDHDLDLAAAWGSGPEDVYVTGKRGLGSMEGVVLHSTDRGASWQRRDTQDQVMAVWGRDARDVYLAHSGGVIEHSVDGGQTWQTEPSGTTDNFSGIAGDARSVVAVGWGLHSELLHRERNVARWTAEPRSTPNGWAAVCADHAGGFFAVGFGIAHSTDGGRTWTNQAKLDRALSGVWCGAQGEAVAVGDQGTILRTRNGGRTWTHVKSDALESDTELAAIWGSPNGSLIAVGKSGEILRSPDRGASWQSARSSAPYLLAIWGSSPHDLYAVGWNGAVLHGTGDESWTTISLGTDAQLVSVWGSGPDDVYLASWFGEIFHSTDRGRTWLHGHVDLANSLSKIWGSGPDDVFVIGSSGTLMHSGDRGKSWQRLATDTDHHLEAIWSDNSGEVDIVGDSGTILQSRDHGRHWQHQRLWAPKAGAAATGLSSVIGNVAGERFAVGSGDSLVYSHDRGKTWEIRPTSLSEPLSSLFLDGDQVFALGYYGKIYQLDRKRTAWTVAGQTQADVSLGASWGDAHDRYLVGYGGTILHRRL